MRVIDKLRWSKSSNKLPMSLQSLIFVFSSKMELYRPYLFLLVAIRAINLEGHNQWLRSEGTIAWRFRRHPLHIAPLSEESLSVLRQYWYYCMPWVLTGEVNNAYLLTCVCFLLCLYVCWFIYTLLYATHSISNTADTYGRLM